MKITRDGKEIELTAEELEEAHAEFVTNFMRMTLKLTLVFRQKIPRILRSRRMTDIAKETEKRSTSASKPYILKAMIWMMAP